MVHSHFRSGSRDGRRQLTLSCLPNTTGSCSPGGFHWTSKNAFEMLLKPQQRLEVTVVLILARRHCIIHSQAIASARRENNRERSMSVSEGSASTPSTHSSESFSEVSKHTANRVCSLTCQVPLLHGVLSRTSVTLSPPEQLKTTAPR